MTARTWTLGELDRVWPWSGERKADGWQWTIRSDGRPVAVRRHTGAIETVEVWNGRIYGKRTGPDFLATKEPDADVALAVIGAHLGHDSPEWMARQLDERATRLADQASVGGGLSDVVHAANKQGASVEAARVATMLRRGRAEP